MEPREKLLVGIVVAIAVVGAAFGARRLYVDRANKLEVSLKYEQRKLSQAKKKLEDAKAKELEWKAIGRQTLSTDEMVAKGRFRGELTRVATESGFFVPPTQVDLISTVPHPGRSGLLLVVYQVKAEGTIDQIVGFLHRLYREPYLVRCKRILLKPLMEKSSSPNAVPKPTGRLSLTMSVETPILPSDKRVPKIDTAELAPDKRVPVGRTLLASVDDYRGIKRELFERYVYQPPPPPPPLPPSTQPVKDPPALPPAPPPPPADAELVLARILSSPRSQQVVLQDPRNPNAEDKRVEVGDSLYGGVLIFIHRDGAVSEKQDKDGRKRTFHLIGQPLKQGQVLSQTEHPAVYDALAKLEERLAGINKPEKAASP